MIWRVFEGIFFFKERLNMGPLTSGWHNRALKATSTFPAFYTQNNHIHMVTVPVSVINKKKSLVQDGGSLLFAPAPYTPLMCPVQQVRCNEQHFAWLENRNSLQQNLTGTSSTLHSERHPSVYILFTHRPPSCCRTEPLSPVQRRGRAVGRSSQPPSALNYWSALRRSGGR